MTDEAALVKERYAKRLLYDAKYDLRDYAALKAHVEKQFHIISFLNKKLGRSVADLHVLEMGCGSGGNLLDLIRIGFDPKRLVGVELLKERHEAAKSILPSATTLIHGNAAKVDLPDNHFDIVYQSTVFTSLLDDGFQEALAQKMWDLTKPGGAILWYDFIYNNPTNKDVRGVSRARVRQLFPKGKFECRSLTLAPPISRRVVPINRGFYDIFVALPLFRTHILCWIEKPKA